MRGIRFFILVGCAPFAACTSVPDLPSNYSVRVSDIVDSIKCELARSRVNAVFDNPPERGWTAGVDLKLEIIANAGFGADAGLAVPLNPGSLVAAVGGTYNASAKSFSSFKFQQLMNETNRAICEKPYQSTYSSGLNGDLGIVTWLAQTQKTFTDTGIQPAEMSYTVEFIINTTGTAGPKFSLLPINNSTASVGGSISGGRKNTHTMTIAFTPRPDPKNYQKVVVVGREPAPTLSPDKAKRPATIDEKNLRSLNDTIQRQIKPDCLTVDNCY